MKTCVGTQCRWQVNGSLSSAYSVREGAALVLRCTELTKLGEGIELTAVFAEPNVVGGVVNSTTASGDVIRSFIVVSDGESMDCTTATQIARATVNSSSTPPVTNGDTAYK